jgi:hypothetical protein
MKKPVVAIFRYSSWKDYGLFKKHPEYSAIFDLIERHRNENFVLMGTSESALSCYRTKDSIIAWDAPLPRR